MTRPARKTAALSVPREGERLHSSPLPPPSLAPPFPEKASGGSGPLGAVDSAGRRKPLEFWERKRFTVGSKLFQKCGEKPGNRKEGGEERIKEKQMKKMPAPNGQFSRNPSLVLGQMPRSQFSLMKVSAPGSQTLLPRRYSCYMLVVFTFQSSRQR